MSIPLPRNVNSLNDPQVYSKTPDAAQYHQVCLLKWFYQNRILYNTPSKLILKPCVSELKFRAHEMHVLIKQHQILFLVIGNYITSKAVHEQIHVFPSSTMHSWNSQKFKVTVWKANHSYSASQCSGRLDVAFSSQQNSIKQVSNHREAVTSEGAYMAITH